MESRPAVVASCVGAEGGRGLQPLSRHSSARWRLGAAAVVLGLLAALAQGFAPWSWLTERPAPNDTAAPFRPLPDTATTPTAAGLAQAERAGIDVHEVIDTVRHRVAPVPGTDLLGAGDDAYRARFGPAGFTLRVGGADLGLSLLRAHRGGEALGLRPGPWRGEANVASRPLAPGLDERVAAREGELEWDLVLAAPPPGRGDLRVEAALTGARSVTRLDGALRFGLAGGTPVRMGELVVKDATGAELYRALPSVQGTRLALEVPASVLARATYPLVVDPTVGPERPASGPPPAPNGQSVPAVAFDGTRYLVVWQDLRAGTTFDIFGARVSTAGVVVDPAGIAISTAAGSQSGPAVAFDGTRYLVVWQDFRSGTTSNIFGARVGTDGVVVDGPAATGGIAVSTAAGSQRVPAVAFDGTRYLVVWEDERSGTSDDIFGARVGTDGVVVPTDTLGIAVSTAANDQSVPAVAFDGTRYLVVWQDLRSGTTFDIFGARVGTDGVVVPTDTLGIAVSTAAGSQLTPAVAFDGARYLVVWRDFRPGAFSDIFGARVGTDGVVQDGGATGGIAVSTAAGDQRAPAVAFDGTRYLVVWHDFRSGTTFDIFGARVGTDGAVLDGPTATGGIAVSTAAGDQFAPAVAFDGTRYLVVWEDSRSGTFDISGARVGTDGAVLDGPPATGGLLLSTGPSGQSSPAVAFDGSRYLVVWQDFRPGTRSDIFGARVGTDGSVLDPAGIPVSTAAGDQTDPAVAFDGTRYLVVWTDAVSDGDADDIRGARVATDGSVLDGPPATGGIAVSTAADEQFAPAVAFDGTNYLVVWQDERVSSSDDIFGARVGTDGSVLDGPPATGGKEIATAAGQQGRPALAFDGTRYLVVWQDFRSGTTFDIFGARVGTDGVVQDGGATVGIAVSTAAEGQLAPAVAFDGTRYLVVWEDERSGTTFDIRGARVTTGGSVLDGSTATGGIAVSTAANDQFAPAVAANGPFLVVWRDRRSTTFDVFAARVAGADGTVQDSSGFAIAAAPTDEGPPAVIRSGGDWAVAYDRLDTTFGANRVFLRTVSPK